MSTTCNKCSKNRVFLLPDGSPIPLFPEVNKSVQFPTIYQKQASEHCFERTPQEPDPCEKPQETVACTPCTSKPVEKACKPHRLSLDWLKACVADKITLLGRTVSGTLGKLIGPGWLHIDEDGYAEVRNEIPVKSTKLFHSYNRDAVNSNVLLGDPLPANYFVVTDENGNHYLQTGLSDQESIQIWDPVTQRVVTRPVSQFPVVQGSKLPCQDRLELVGFSPVPEGGSFSTPRPLQSLCGEGILVAKKVKTAVTQLCNCDDCQTVETSVDETTVFEFVPFPDTTCDPDKAYVLSFQNGTVAFVDPATNPALKGEKGEKGDTGGQGPRGLQGKTGNRGSSVVACDGTVNNNCLPNPTLVVDPISGTLILNGEDTGIPGGGGAAVLTVDPVTNELFMNGVGTGIVINQASTLTADPTTNELIIDDNPTGIILADGDCDTCLQSLADCLTGANQAPVLLNPIPDANGNEGQPV